MESCWCNSDSAFIFHFFSIACDKKLDVILLCLLLPVAYLVGEGEGITSDTVQRVQGAKNVKKSLHACLKTQIGKFTL